MKNCAKVVAVLLALALPLAMADSPTAAIGSWTLDLTKSSYQPGPAPQSETRTYEMIGDSTKLTVKTETADGQVHVGSGTYKVDGKAYPISGAPGFDAIAVHRVDRWQARATLMRSGKVIGHISTVVSKDGNVLTETTTMSTADGQKMHDVAVFDRQH